MAFVFQKHYTREEAQALLPQLRVWLREIREQRDALQHLNERFADRLQGGDDLGGETINRWVKLLIDLNARLLEFSGREIQLKDIDRGLVDFPAILAGREVFLCWEQDEEDIEFWHELATGFAGRERLP